MKKRLSGQAFEAVFTSPLQRATRTCEIAGLFKNAKTDHDLVEWNYGDFEGLTTDQIRKQQPHWDIFSNGAPNGESVADVSARASKMLAKLHSFHGDVALFSHGHFLRALAARWLQLPAQDGRLFNLFPASVSILGYERAVHVLTLWNDTSHLSV
jgi:broad specificity phosphatase PhoE